MLRLLAESLLLAARLRPINSGARSRDCFRNEDEEWFAAQRAGRLDSTKR